MWVSSEEVEKARETPLLDFIEANHIETKKEGRYYRLVEHDSFIIQGEKFTWNSRQESGVGSISFAKLYYDLNFQEAVKRINSHDYKHLTKTHPHQEEYHKPFRYPDYFETNNTLQIKNYLCQERKIDPRVVDWCIKKDLLVQDKKENAVFKWKNSKGEIIGGDRQGTRKMDNKRGTFKGIIPNSKSDGGFTIDVGNKLDKIAFFESPIDMLSYWSIKKNALKDTRLVSMNGLKKQTVATAMGQFAKDGHQIRQVLSCVDNDKAGDEFQEELNKIPIINNYMKEDRPRYCKDWNDQLNLNLRKKQTKQKQYGM